LGEGEVDHNYVTAVGPNSDFILFGIQNDATGDWDNAQVVIQSLATGQRKVLFEGGQGGHYAPTGHLVYGRAGTLLAVPVDFAEAELKGTPLAVVEGVMHGALGPQFRFAENGTLAYIPAQAGGQMRSLVWVDRRGVEEELLLAPAEYKLPRLSPDGKHLAVGVVDADLNADIRVFDLERHTLTRRLTTFTGEDISPVWTPDGRRIYYKSLSDAFVFSWRDVDGAGEGVIDRRGVPQSISSDGLTLAFVVPTDVDTGRDIGILSLEGDFSRRLLFETPFAEDGPALSPDGRFIAYTSTESGRSEVYVSRLSKPSEDRWQLSSEGGTFPTWSRDSQELFYLDGAAMMVARVTANPTFTWSQPEVLFEGRYVSGAFGWGRPYDVAPDGQRFLMMKSADGSAATQINIVLNWFDELERLVQTEN
jgi:serine/threonine-protein kinase